MPVNSPLRRQRPWISDGVWVAHEALPLFQPMAQMLTHNGVWKLRQGGPVQLPGLNPGGLVEAMDGLAVAAQPCVVRDMPAEYADSSDDLSDALVYDQRLQVLDSDGGLWSYNLSITTTATMNQDGWSWKLAPNPTGMTLVGFDRKDRIRFALAPVVLTDDEQDPLVPVLPGIIPELTDEWKQLAMDQAHEDLPDIPGTQVVIHFFTLDEGYRRLAEAGWSDDQLAQLRVHAAEIGGPDPHMAIATREDHHP